MANSASGSDDDRDHVSATGSTMDGAGVLLGRAAPRDDTLSTSDLDERAMQARLHAKMFGAAPAPVRVGRFVVLERIGAGAMGVVFGGYDDVLDRKVAIKVIASRSLQSADARERMLREAKALARLSHPNVVQVYEAGEYEGSVFVAMEFVRGKTLGDWLGSEERTEATIDGVLDLLVQAGRGLAAAHAQGIVHRDFKPHNAMVGDDGRVRVLDFGLARAEATDAEQPTLDDISEAAPSLTATGTIMGTPAYMAPEQWEGQPADARTDQYAFCVTLSEALYGVPPIRRLTAASLRSAVLEGECDDPPPNADVPAWLQQIVRRGMAVHPEDRWPSMDALLAELSRDRTRARRRALTGVATVVGLVGAAGLGTTLADTPDPCVGGGDAIAAAWNPTRRSEVEAAFVATDRNHAAPTFERVAAGLDRYADDWEAMRAESCRATRIEGTQSAELLDLRAACLGRRRVALQALVDLFVTADAAVVDGAVDAVEGLPRITQCEDAEALRRVTPRPTDANTVAELESLETDLAAAWAAFHAGKLDLAAEAAPDLLVRAQSLDYLPVTARATYLSGETRWVRDRDEGARDVFIAAVDAATTANDDTTAAAAAGSVAAMIGHDMPHAKEGLGWAKAAEWIARRTKDPVILAQARSTLALVLWSGDRYDEAANEFRGALDLLSERDDRPGMRGTIERNYASLLREAGHNDEARELLGDALRRIAETHGVLHPDYAAAMVELGNLALGSSALDDATQWFQRAHALLEQIYGANHPKTLDALHNIGLVDIHAGRLEQAAQLFEEELASYRAAGRPGDPGQIGPLDALAQVHAREGKHAEAVAEFRRAFELATAAYGPEHSVTILRAVNVGIALQLDGKLEESRKILSDTVERLRRLHDGDHPDLALALKQLGNTAYTAHDIDAAAHYWTEALAMNERLHGSTHPDVATGVRNLSTIAYEKEDWPEAKRLSARALKLDEATYGADHHDLAFPLSSLGDAEIELGELDAAVEHCRRALRVWDASNGTSEIVPQSRYCLARALWARNGDGDRAEARTSAVAALEELAALGEGSDDLRRTVRAWLDARAG